jgi:cysteine desulfurase/selenocysteine lyase
MKPDFYVFSSHKMYGPTGVGILYIGQNIKKSIANFQTGGGAIKSVNINETVFMPLPQKLEPGTPNISGIIGLKSAINYINTVTINNIEKIESHIMNYAENLLNKMRNVNLITSFSKSCILCFTLKDIHPHDITTILNEYKIAIRTGFLCAEPLLNYLNIHSINRISVVFYNTVSEVERVYCVLKKIKWILRK